MISTNQAAKKLGIASSSLSRYIASGKIPPPKTVMAGDLEVHDWTEEEIEQARILLPKIANGRKTRWKRQKEQEKKRAKAKSEKTQPRAAAVRKPKRK